MQLPAPLRAAIGLAASAADEARQLPDRAIELPMLAVSTVLQMSLRAQQRYAALTARGDEVLRRTPSDDPPPWATFDDPVAEPGDAVSGDPLRRTGAYTDGRRAAQILDQILGTSGIAHDLTHDDDSDADAPTPITAARSAPPQGTRKPVPKAAPAGKDGPAGKRVSKPRAGRPSKFDDATD